MTWEQAVQEACDALDRWDEAEEDGLSATAIYDGGAIEVIMIGAYGFTPKKLQKNGMFAEIKRQVQTRLREIQHADTVQSAAWSYGAHGRSALSIGFQIKPRVAE